MPMLGRAHPGGADGPRQLPARRGDVVPDARGVRALLPPDLGRPQDPQARPDPVRRGDSGAGDAAEPVRGDGSSLSRSSSSSCRSSSWCSSPSTRPGRSRSRSRGFSLRWYRDVFSSFEFREALKNSAIVATVTAAVTLLLGTAAAYGLSRMPRRAARADVAPLLPAGDASRALPRNLDAGLLRPHRLQALSRRPW